MLRCLLGLLLLHLAVCNSSNSTDSDIDYYDDGGGFIDFLLSGDEPKHEKVSSDHEEHGEGAVHEAHGVQLASFKFDYVKKPLILTTFIVLIGLFKLLYHHTRYIQKLVPESCCLIFMGVALGLCFLGGNTENVKFLEFDSRTFFFYLLPPIILEASYSLKDRAFLENLGTIILYAVVGTVLNIAIIGGSLISLSYAGWLGSFVIDPLDCLVFASLIAAVDPVAVLAIFQEVGVNKMLYFMVFGESLLNDAVTVVCYTLMGEFKALPHISISDCIMGLLAFLFVSFGGIIIGTFFGLLSAFITKYTQHVRVVEPVILFGTAYLAYICSELFHWSGIIGILVCGLVQAHYTSGNISSKSFISVTYFAKVTSSVTESLIFIILGVMLVNENGWFWSDWHPLFALYSLLLCIIARIIVVFFLTYLANRYTGGVRYISFQEQFIMAYGGLRGAVSFSLAFMISDSVAARSTLLAATYIVILFTVFVQGCTIKPLVRFLNIRLAGKDDHLRLFMEFNKGMIVHLSQGIEDLCGYKDTRFMSRAGKFSKACLRPYLERNYQRLSKAPEEKLLQMDRAVTMNEMRKISSANSFTKHQEIERMAEEGEISREMIENEENFHDIEQATEELIKDTEHIRQLIRNPLDDFYHNRNLVAEDEKEERQEKQKERLDHLRELHDRASQMVTTRNGSRKRTIFGKNRSKKSTSHGIVLASLGTLGVQSIHSEDSERHRTLSTIREQASGEETMLTRPKPCPVSSTEEDEDEEE